MKTIFLAAGRSSRMNPIGDKNLLEFCGHSLILHLLGNAQLAGCEEFIIVCNETNEATIKTLLGITNLNFKTVLQPNLKDGMAGGILAALEVVNPNDSLLIINGNDYVDPSAIKKVIEVGVQNDGALLGQVRDTYFPGGYLEVDEENNIKSIIEKPGEGNEPSNLVNIVIHYIKVAKTLKTALESTNSKSDDVYEVALDACFKEKKFKAVKYTGQWQAIKYPWHVLEMMDIFLKHTKENLIDESAEIAPSATIKGKGIRIAAGVKIHENAVISGPCYIGKNTIIGNNVLIRDSMVGANNVIGYNTEIARSYLSSNVTTHIAYIGDSIIESGVNFGAYSCTANLRLDGKSVRVKIKKNLIDSGHQKLGAIVGKNVQIGVGAKLMPGVKLNTKSHVHPNEIVLQ